MVCLGGYDLTVFQIVFYRSWNPPKALVRFRPKLQKLESNNLHCDCNAFWLQEWVKKKEILTPPKIVCNSPLELRAKNLSSLNKEQFPCGKCLIFKITISLSL